MHLLAWTVADLAGRDAPVEMISRWLGDAAW
jgi:hypothetical protein